MYAILFILTVLASALGGYYIMEWLNPENLGEILGGLLLVIIYASTVGLIFGLAVKALVK